MGVAGYHLLETWPNVKSSEGRMHRADHLGLSDTPGIHTRFWMRYRTAAFNQVYAMWATGGIGYILGVIGVVRARGTFRILAIVATAASVAALIVSLTTIMASRIG